MEELDRIQYRIMETLFQNEAINKYHGMTIEEIMKARPNLGIKMTVWRKMNFLVAQHYIDKGILAGRSDTYYLLDKGLEICKSYCG